MIVASRRHLVLELSACALVLILATVWGEVPAGYGPCPQDPAEPYVIAHCILGPSQFVMALKLAIALLAVAAAAVFAARAALRLEVIVGAAAASFCSVLGVLARHAVAAQVFDVGFAPSLSTMAIVASVFFLFGALVAWATVRWWPNTSLKRTREG